MIRLRPYKPCDAANIAAWCQDKKTYETWGGDLLGAFPLSAEDINAVYLDQNGLCAEEDNFYPMTALDDDEMAGSFIIRYIHGDRRILRFGWVIVDSAKRGEKIGQRMLTAGLKYAFEILGAEQVTIGVFENNIAGYKCYKAVGFHKPSDLPDSFKEVDGETWKVVELAIRKEDYADPQ